MNNDSLKNFRNQLLNQLNKFKTYKALALFLNISDDTLKSWFNGHRIPTLRTIDKISDKIGCYSWEIISTNTPNSGKIVVNDSHSNFSKNIKMIFIEKQCFLMVKKLNLLNHCITDLMLTSYLRSDNYRMPTLSNLDNIANELGIESYKLIMEESL